MKLIKKALKFLKEHGLKRFTRRLFTYPLERVKIELSKRRHVFRPYLNKKEIRYIIGQMREKPLISILMPVYNVPPEFLEKAIHSVINQYYPNWELCIADDCSTNQDTRITLQKFAALNSRIKVTFLDANVGIAEATNAAAKTATGDYFSFMDHDDELTHDALFETIKAIKNHGVDLVYSDEAVINPQGLILNIHFKPDFNFELFLSHNYITHFVTVKREIFFKVNGMETKYKKQNIMALKIINFFLRLFARQRKSTIFHACCITGGLSQALQPVVLRQNLMQTKPEKWHLRIL